MKGFLALLIGFIIGLLIDDANGLTWENSSTLATSMLVWIIYLFYKYGGGSSGGDGEWLADDYGGGIE